MATFSFPLLLLATIAHSQTPSTTSNPVTTTSGCSSSYAFVNVESSLLTLSETVPSQRVHFAPYTYTQSITQTKLSIFANQQPITDKANNPCDPSTWTIAPAYYDNTIVMMEYSSYFEPICTIQQWTLNLQNYANVHAVLIANNRDANTVYPLSGSSSLPDPVIPTRMISENAALNILNITTTTNEDVFVSVLCETTPNIVYPSAICMKNPTPNSYSNYQSYYGLYILDTTASYDGRYVYYNQRLNGKPETYYFVWYKEKNAWILNDVVPSNPVIQTINVLCNADVATPDLCTSCWQFYGVYPSEVNCNVQALATTSLIESDCVNVPINNIPEYTQRISLCFNDGVTDIYSNEYSGFYQLAVGAQYNDRAVWHKEATVPGGFDYFLYYDDVHRLWVIDHVFSSHHSSWDLYCLHWDEFEPFGCNQWYSLSTNSAVTMTTYCYPTNMPSIEPTTEPSVSPTVEGCSSNYAFVAVESVSGTFSETATSLRVDYAPYAYPQGIIKNKLVVFAAGEDMTINSNNPCNVTTWTYPGLYNGNVVMIYYNEYFINICSVQQWTLNLEQYANVIAVLVANDADLTHVFSINGVKHLPDPTIPTRMISQVSAKNILNAMNRTGEEILVSIDCFNSKHPTVICMLDDSMYGYNARFDGEYQQQSNILVNDHPVWLKEGMNLVWDDYYIWLRIDHGLINNPWTWVIGADYNNDSSILAECVLNTTEYIDDPTKCGRNWEINGKLIGSLISHDGICDLGDIHICADSGSPWFDYYFAGRYRQVHDGIPLWLGDNTLSDAFIGVMYVDNTLAPGWSFVFAYASTGNIYAWCPINSDPNIEPTPKQQLAPWNCNANWYNIANINGDLQWINDPLMDVDQCSHPNDTTAVKKEIIYPKALCFIDPTYKYSHYQTYYGIYILDNTTSFNERFVYRNQRLMGKHEEWYLIWYDQKDSWIINHQFVPSLAHVGIYEGICRDNVDTPDQCGQCWEFYQGIQNEINCNVTITPIATTNEADCMIQPTHPPHVIADLSLCFDDGSTPIYSNKYTGKWQLETTKIWSNRAYWYKKDSTGNIEYYMYYDQVWRFWVINPYITAIEQMWEIFCLHWDEIEPHNCNVWYKNGNDNLGETISMTECTQMPTTTPTSIPSMSPTLKPTPYPTTQCLSKNKYIYAQSILQQFPPQTIASSEVNFPPYSYSTFYQKRLVIFENGRNITTQNSNPCDSNTWSEPAAFYDGNIVMIEYSDFIMSLCSPQQWTLQLEGYANVIAVVIANTADWHHVYALSGDSSLMDTTIPTRMISQFVAVGIKQAILYENDAIYLTFGCWNDKIEYPSIICLVDTSMIGHYVYIDGEYQRQVDVEINDHPVWYKIGHQGLWKNIYMFLDVDQSVIGDRSWRWVIGTNYNDRNSIFAECDVNGTHIDHPALCGHHWRVNHILETSITTSDTTCELGDNYICVDSAPGGFFGQYFDGQYRQIHDGVSLWLLENSAIDAYITIGQISFPPMFNNEYVFAFMLNQTHLYAFCEIGATLPSQSVALSPWNCNRDWYVMAYSDIAQYHWALDLAFDIDECSHPHITVNETEIVYPEMLCIRDPTNAYSHYQSKYGVYILDNTTSFDGKYVYYNQRLKGNDNEWYMIYYDEKDAWIINQMIPGVTYVQDTDAICRQDVSTPDLCTKCWEFYQGFIPEQNCNVEVVTVTTNNENACMTLPDNDVSTISTYTDSISLCFTDGIQSNWDNSYTGKWVLNRTDTHQGRKYWYKMDRNGDTQYYMFYDSIWRQWVISVGFTTDLDYYCLRWDEFEPFKCDLWFSSHKNTVNKKLMYMTTDCESNSPTPEPTPYPTASCSAQDTYIYVESALGVFQAQTLTSEHVNFPPYGYNTFYREKLVLFENGRISMVGSSNPCNSSTWVEDVSFYEGNVVMIESSDFRTNLCSPQQWTLELESYANIMAVIVGNDRDLHHVYALSGDSTLFDPTIPTRMIAQFPAIGISIAIMHDNDEISVSFGCFDHYKQYPSIICLIDMSLMGHHVFLDGEYSRQAFVEINDHPVWYKMGHQGLWKNIYMFLDVDTSVTGDNSWRWVIGTDYNDPNTIIAECLLNGIHIDHPALCGPNWHIDGILEANINTSDTTCALGDNYVCVEAAPGGVFDYHFSGPYRQIHDGVPVWIHEYPWTDIYITLGQLVLPPMVNTQQYVFAFVINQTNIWAFCIIGEEEPTNTERLTPYDCNKDWYVMHWVENTGYQWVIDLAFDVDECNHPQIQTTATKIDYPQILCLTDSSNKSSPYQGHFGVYLLDNTTSYDDRYIYYNQRLKGNHDEWYMLWYDEKDAWVINQMVPQMSWVQDTEGICRENVLTPDLCNECWQFYTNYGLSSELNCDIKVVSIDSVNEADCMKLPVDSMSAADYTTEITLGFDDGIIDIANHPYTGKWRIGKNGKYGDRAYWYKVKRDYHGKRDYNGNRRLLETEEAAFYMFYDATWRYWVIDTVLGRLSKNEWHLYCFEWYEFEPFNCNTWWNVDIGIKMLTTYTLPPTSVPTMEPTINTAAPSSAPTSYINIIHKTVTKKENPYTWIEWLIAFVMIIWGLSCCVVFYYKQKQKRKGKHDFKGSMDAMTNIAMTTTPSTMRSPSNDGVIYGSGTIRGKGEVISLHDEDDSNDHSKSSDRKITADIDGIDGIDGIDNTGDVVMADDITNNNDNDDCTNLLTRNDAKNKQKQGNWEVFVE